MFNRGTRLDGVGNGLSSRDYYTELKSCVKVEVDVLGSPVPNTISMDVKHQ